MMPTKPQNTSESSVFPRATAITLGMEGNRRASDVKGTGELQSFVDAKHAPNLTQRGHGRPISCAHSTLSEVDIRTTQPEQSLR